jgi:hypothetical protein
MVKDSAKKPPAAVQAPFHPAVLTLPGSSWEAGTADVRTMPRTIHKEVSTLDVKFAPDEVVWGGDKDIPISDDCKKRCMGQFEEQ